MDVIESIETLSLDEYLIKNKESTYFLKVIGDRLQKFNINEGDMILVERGKSPRDGDLIIFWNEDHFSLGIFNKEEKINPEAVVTSLIRKYE